jgi:hypothetical protein
MGNDKNDGNGTLLSNILSILNNANIPNFLKKFNIADSNNSYANQYNILTLFCHFYIKYQLLTFQSVIYC